MGTRYSRRQKLTQTVAGGPGPQTRREKEDAESQAPWPGRAQGPVCCRRAPGALMAAKCQGVSLGGLDRGLSCTPALRGGGFGQGRCPWVGRPRSLGTSGSTALPGLALAGSAPGRDPSRGCRSRVPAVGRAGTGRVTSAPLFTEANMNTSTELNDHLSVSNFLPANELLPHIV